MSHQLATAVGWTIQPEDLLHHCIWEQKQILETTSESVQLFPLLGPRCRENAHLPATIFHVCLVKVSKW